MGSVFEHQNLIKAFCKAVSVEFPDVFILPYTVGMFRDFETASRIIRAGIKGVPDLVILGDGWYLFLDAKTGNARFSKEQLAFKARIESINKNRSIVFKLTSVTQGISILKTLK
jgi:hypothetical protein